MTSPFLEGVPVDPVSSAIAAVLYNESVAQSERGLVQLGQVRSSKGVGRVVALGQSDGGWKIIHHTWAAGDIPRRMIRQVADLSGVEYHELLPRAREILGESYKNAKVQSRRRGPRRRLK